MPGGPECPADWSQESLQRSSVPQQGQATVTVGQGGGEGLSSIPAPFPCLPSGPQLPCQFGRSFLWPLGSCQNLPSRKQNRRTKAAILCACAFLHSNCGQTVQNWGLVSCRVSEGLEARLPHSASRCGPVPASKCIPGGPDPETTPR